MNFLGAFSSYNWLIFFILWCIIGALFSFVTVYDYVEHNEKPPVIAWLVYGLILVVFIGLGIYGFSDRGLRAEPTPEWEKRARQAKVAIVLGFGYGPPKDGEITPEKSNIFLLQWTLDHTGADIILAQEGVMAAAHSVKPPRKVALQRMHIFDPNKYVDTLDTAYCALSTLEQLHLGLQNEVILVAHDLQLQRAAWDFIRVRQNNPKWKNIQFIIPNIPDTPYPDYPAAGQWHTGGQLRYKLGEVFWARPRDYMATTQKEPTVSLDLNPSIIIR